LLARTTALTARQTPPRQTPHRRLPNAALIAALLVGASLLPACGRRGPLEPPPGTSGRAAPTAAETQANSSFAGSPRIQPMRQTETTANTADPDAPQAPPQAAEMVAGPGAVNAASTPTISRSGGAARGARRSPPPTTPFILDPLL
jgi:predicted small lipoprotein YifL